MMKSKLVLFVWALVFSGISLAFAAEGEGADTLYESSLTVNDSISYDESKLDASVEIDKNGKVKLSIVDLMYLDSQLYTNKTCTLVIETEVNDVVETYEFPFEIEEGMALVEEDLGLQVGVKLEIVNVVITEEVTPPGTPTPSPVVTASPSSATSPTPVATVSPTPTTSPVAMPTATVTPSATPVSNASASLSVDAVELLVPGGLIEEVVTSPTPTPSATPAVTATPAATPTEPSATPTATPSAPSVIEADVSFQSRTINLHSNGKFIAYIKLPSSYDLGDIVCETVVCEGAVAWKCDEKEDKLKVKFNIKDLEVDSDLKTNESENVEFTITGELSDGTKFEGSDTVKIKGSKKGKDDDGDDDDDDEDEDYDDDDDNKGKDKGKGKGKGKK
ncbi:MAG: hypothetical protein E3K37_11080 [Candidatus Kuenenia sp.]|nr:hypothetical protein [Candidatus Kuenenia hertensis]